MNKILQQWDTIKKGDNGLIPYEFMKIFEHIITPYYSYGKLTPSDRVRIELDVEESLKGECEITKECSNEIIKKFSHKLIFNILHKYKNCPSKIGYIIGIINAQD